MTPARAGALFMSAACLFPVGSAHAQNAAALAKAAARSADAFDTLVTPAALNALRRMADSIEAKKAEKPAAATRTSAAPPRTGRAAPKRNVTPPPVAEAAEQPVATAAETGADSVRPITDIVARRLEDVVELRIIAAGHGAPALSEPFRAGEYSRLFVTFDDAKLALASPPALAEAGTLLAGMDIAERDNGVRIALDVATLGAYELAMSGDTAVLRLAAPAAVVADAEETPLVTRPDDLALARKAARAGWVAFRGDVGKVTSALGGFVAAAGSAVAGAAGSGWHTMSGAVTGAATWVAASIPFAGIARALVLLALLGAPPLFALRLLRRRQAAVRAPAPAEIVGLEAHARSPAVVQKAVVPVAAKQPKTLFARGSKIEKTAKARKSDPNARNGRKPAVTRTTADARLWAARTLADNGADVAEIARQTGLSREQAILLVRRSKK